MSIFKSFLNQNIIGNFNKEKNVHHNYSYTHQDILLTISHAIEFKSNPRSSVIRCGCRYLWHGQIDFLLNVK